MRLRFRECETYFTDSETDAEEYLPENVIGVPTEREVSVLVKGLPVYRAHFLRSAERADIPDDGKNVEPTKGSERW